MERIPQRVDSTFRYILVAAKRAEQLMRGARAKVEIPHAKAARLAMREVTEELIDWDYGPMPVPEPPPAELAETAPSEESSI
jgi:DNA-directed RNA polymerase subunit K/omega